MTTATDPPYGKSPAGQIDRRLGEVLKEVRRRRGLTQEVLAEALGCSPQQVQKYEAGRNRMSVATLIAAAGVLQVPPAALLEISREAEAETPFRDLPGLLVRLRPEERRLVAQLIRTLADRHR